MQRNLILTAICLVLSILNGSAQSLEPLRWMAGDWVLEQGESITTESWSYMNDSTLVGSSTTMKEGEIVMEEALKIEQRSGSIRYIALLPTKLVTFQMKELKKKGTLFTNSKNDFPSAIRYSKKGEKMEVILSGNGKTKEMQFSPKESR